jgi:hypothetical protein
MTYNLKYYKFRVIPRVLRMRFDVYAWIMACEVRGLEFPNIEFQSELEARVALMYGGYVSQCRASAKKEKLSFADIYEIYKGASVSEVEKISVKIAQTKILGKPVIEYAKEAEQEEKKN